MRWLIVLCLVACSAGSPGPGLPLRDVLNQLTAITAIGPRPQDSEGSRRAAAYIKSQLDALEDADVRVQKVGDVDIPGISVLGVKYRDPKRVSTTDSNIFVRFGPQGNPLVLIAHYDTVPGSTGGIDNAVAVALLIELARALHEHPPATPIALLFTADEEVGLVGAESFAEKYGKQMEFAIALDLVGGSGDLVLNGASTLIGQNEMQWLAAAADRAGVIVRAPLAHRVISRWWPQAERSDHGAFTRRGIRAFHLYNRGTDGEWIDLAYHSRRDLPTRVDTERVDEAGRLLLALVASPLPARDGDGFWLPIAANTVIPRWILIVVELLLLLGVIALLARRLVTHLTGDRVRTRGPGLLVGAACYALALGAAFAFERLEPYPGSWLHAPLRTLIAELLVIVGVVGLASRVVARFSPWVGAQRYLALSAIVLAMFGTTLLVLGAAELAWIWLLPALLVAVAPRLGPAAPLALASAALPIALVLHPFQVREAAWNGFWPPDLPLALWLGVLALPVVAGGTWWFRRHRTWGPLGTLVLSVGCGVAVIAGFVVVITYRSPCTAAKFDSFHLACERV